MRLNQPPLRVHGPSLPDSCQWSRWAAHISILQAYIQTCTYRPIYLIPNSELYTGHDHAPWTREPHSLNTNNNKRKKEYSDWYMIGANVNHSASVDQFHFLILFLFSFLSHIFSDPTIEVGLGSWEWRSIPYSVYKGYKIDSDSERGMGNGVKYMSPYMLLFISSHTLLRLTRRTDGRTDGRIG